MKNLVFLYIGENSANAFEKVFSGKSAFERSLVWASGISDLCGIVAACSEENKNAVELISSSFGKDRIKIVSRENWNTAVLIEEMLAQVSCFSADDIVFTPADRPFLDMSLTAEILESHRKYISEYTFADGYPYGFAPEVINSGTLKILSVFASETHKELGTLPVSNDCIFNIMKSDINSFEIESVIAPKDFRMLRLDFSCSQKRNFVACQRLYSRALKNKIPFTAEKLSFLAENCVDVQQTLPAFYNVQISENCLANPFYSPYPQAFKNKFGFFPFENENKNPRDMTLEKFDSLVGQISAFSDDAVIGLSAWGEPLLNKNFTDFVEVILRRKNLSVLVETDGILVTEQLASKILEISERTGKRKNGTEPVTWIVSIDSFTEDIYNKIFENGNFSAAVNSISILNKIFPSSVYPQFTRMNENESELENFYRFWHSKDSPSGGKVIIQKYNDFCRLLPSRKPADLSPLERNVCWHLKRDMTILCTGEVPLCRQFLLSSAGNVFDEGVETIWKKYFDEAQRQLEKNYGEKCKSCDEYYTFNF